MGSSEAEPKPNRSRHNVASLLCTPETTECRIEARVNESRGEALVPRWPECRARDCLSPSIVSWLSLSPYLSQNCHACAPLARYEYGMVTLSRISPSSSFCFRLVMTTWHTMDTAFWLHGLS